MKTPPIKVNESEDAFAQEQTKARRIGNAVPLTLTVQKHPDKFVFRWNRHHHHHHHRVSFDSLPGIGLRLPPATYREIVEGRA